ncbi:hypothetical protein Tco_0442770 [Tanacetum coccineum]
MGQVKDNEAYEEELLDYDDEDEKALDTTNGKPAASEIVKKYVFEANNEMAEEWRKTLEKVVPVVVGYVHTKMKKLAKLRHKNILTPLAYHFRNEEELLASEYVTGCNGRFSPVALAGSIEVMEPPRTGLQYWPVLLLCIGRFHLSNGTGGTGLHVLVNFLIGEVLPTLGYEIKQQGKLVARIPHPLKIYILISKHHQSSQIIKSIIMPKSIHVDHHDTSHYIPMYHRTQNVTEREREIYKSLERRLFHEGRVVDPSYLEDQPNLRPTFAAIGFDCLLDINEKICPIFVLQFYKSVRLVRNLNGTLFIAFIIRNVEITLRLEEFACILHVPCRGVCVFTSEWAIPSLPNGVDSNPDIYPPPHEGPLLIRDALFYPRPPGITRKPVPSAAKPVPSGTKELALPVLHINFKLGQACYHHPNLQITSLKSPSLIIIFMASSANFSTQNLLRKMPRTDLIDLSSRDSSPIQNHPINTILDTTLALSIPPLTLGQTNQTQGNIVSPLAPRALVFCTSPNSLIKPHPYLASLDDLPPRSSNPQPQSHS